MHARFRLYIVSVLVSLLSACSPSPQRGDHGEFVDREVAVDGISYRYQVFVPALSAAGDHPAVILFLHGSGERGRDNRKQLAVGLGPRILAQMDRFQAIAVFPQAPENTAWTGASARMAIAAMDAATREFQGDTRRTYLTGLSMGGYGVWELALMQPDRFAALVPICGAIKPLPDEPALQVTQVAGERDPYARIAERLRAVPIWIFHGARDDVVPPEDDRRLVAAFKAIGATNMHYTEFPEANHNAWDPAYGMPELGRWVWRQHR